MSKLALRAATALLAAPGLALASGDSGTGAVAEMQVTGKQFGMMIGALVALGVVIWLVAKFATGGGTRK